MAVTQRPVALPSSGTSAFLFEAFVRTSTRLLGHDNLDARMVDALGLFGEAAGVDGGAFLDFQDAESDPGLAPSERTRWRVRYAWEAPGRGPQQLTPGATGTLADLPFAAELLRLVTRTGVPAPDTVARSDGAAPQAPGPRRPVAAPINVGGRLRGALVFEGGAAARLREPDAHDVLVAVAQAFGLAAHNPGSPAHGIAVAHGRTADPAPNAAALTTRSHLLTVISEESGTLLNAEDLFAAIGQMLRRVGEAAELSRVLYAEERARLGGPLGARDHHVLVGWCAPGIPDHATLGVTVLPSEALEASPGTSRRREPVWVREDELPPATRAALAPLAIRATGYAPVFVEGAYVGRVVFTDCVTARPWGAANVDALTAVANVIGAALQSRRMRDRLTRDREWALMARAVDLAKADEVLRRAADGVVAAAEVGGTLSVLLREVIAVAGASGGAVLRRVGGGTRFECAALLDAWRDGGSVLTGETLRHNPAAAAIPECSERDPSGAFAELVQGRTVFGTMDEVVKVLPALGRYARVHGLRTAWSVPFSLRSEVTGYLAMFTSDERQPDALVQARVATLASQVAVALDLTRRAEEAQDVSAARARELVAQERAAAFGRANVVLRDGLQRLVGPGDLSAFLSHAVAAVAEQAGAVRVDLFRYDAARHLARQMFAVVGGVVLDRGLPDDPPEIRAGIPSAGNEGWARLALERVPALHFFVPPDAPCLPFAVDWHRRMGHTGACLLGLIGVNGPLGVLAMAFDRPYDVPEVQQEVILALGNQITLALELDRLGDEKRRGAIAEERAKIARELHDTVAQGLAAIVMQLGAARTKLGAAAERAAPELARVERVAHSTLDVARRGIVTLRPATLSPGGLDAALRHAVASLREIEPGVLRGARLTYQLCGTPVRLPAEVEFELLRVAEAALTNAVQHAGARAICAELTFDPAEGVRVVVVDDGRGFDPAAPPDGRFGLVGMAERAARIGAVLTLVTAPGEGTHVVVNWPHG